MDTGSVESGGTKSPSEVCQPLSQSLVPTTFLVKGSANEMWALGGSGVAAKQGSVSFCILDHDHVRGTLGKAE